MKLSKETVGIFKNFAGINSNLLLKQGNKIATISAQKNVMSDTVVTETFPSDFGIYDLNEFLGAMSLFDDPELDFYKEILDLQDVSAELDHVYKYNINENTDFIEKNAKKEMKKYGLTITDLLNIEPSKLIKSMTVSEMGN